MWFFVFARKKTRELPTVTDRKSFCGTIRAPPVRSFGWKPRFPRRPPSALRGDIKYCTAHRSDGRKGPLVQRGLCPKGGGGLYRQAGDNNPSVTYGATSLCTREAQADGRWPSLHPSDGSIVYADRQGCRSLRCLTEALFSRPFALKARGNTHRALGGPPKVVEGSFDKPGKG